MICFVATYSFPLTCPILLHGKHCKGSENEEANVILLIHPLLEY